MLDRPSLTFRDRLTLLVEEILSQDPLARPDRIKSGLREAGMTSLDTVRLVLGIEAEFGVMIGADDLDPENFATLDSLEALIDRLCG